MTREERTKAEHFFLSLWDQAVGKPGYNKRDWREVQKAIWSNPKEDKEEPMREIKSVTLLQPLPEIHSGTVGKKIGYTLWHFALENVSISFTFQEDFILAHSDWFQVEYQEEEKKSFSLYIRVGEYVGNSQRADTVAHWIKSENENVIREAAKFLTSQLKDWLSRRCKKCGGELRLFASYCKDCHPKPSCEGCEKLYWVAEHFFYRCQSCGEVAG